MNKQELRIQMKKRRSDMGKIETDIFSEIIQKKLFSEEIYINSDCILTYIDCKNEVSTSAIVRNALNAGKKVAVPKVNGREMDFYYIQSLSELKKGYQGIYEPETSSGQTLAQITNGLCIVPGLAFDYKMNRIGYGGGFYDRYFYKYPNLFKCALCFDFQITDDIISDSFDVKMDMIISQGKLLRSDD